MQASHWASATSRRYKAYVKAEGESGDQTHQSGGKVELKTKVEGCDCERTLLVEKERVGGENGSTCSQESYVRGPGQRVVGFSFYGNPDSAKGKERKYFQVLKYNKCCLH